MCDWSDRKKMFIEVEGILRRQIKVLVDLFEFNRTFVILVKFSVKTRVVKV